MNGLCSTVADRRSRPRKAAGGVLTAKQASHRPGTAPALGLRAGNDVSPVYRRPKGELTMSFEDLFKSLTLTSSRRRPARRPSSARLSLEALEDRCVLSNYLLTDLGLQSAGDINNHGQVAGQKRYETGDYAVLWQNGTAINLGTLGEPGSFSTGLAVSDAGHVVGYSHISVYPSPDSFELHAFLVTPEDTDQDGVPDRWFRDSNSDGRNDLMINLGTLGGAESIARDVNAFGQVVGETSYSRAFIWSGGVMTDLGTLSGPTSLAYAINDAGQVLGSSSGYGFLINPEDTNADGVPDRWYRDTNGDGTNDFMIVLPSETGSNSDINASGQVVNDNGLWTPDTPNGTTGTLTDLGNFSALALNGSAQVVGLQGDGLPDDHEGGGGYGWTWAALWEQGTTVDLNTRIVNAPSGVGLTSAGAINDQGWILATTNPYDGRYNVPFLLT